MTRNTTSNRHSYTLTAVVLVWRRLSAMVRGTGPRTRVRLGAVLAVAVAASLLQVVAVVDPAVAAKPYIPPVPKVKQVPNHVIGKDWGRPARPGKSKVLAKRGQLPTAWTGAVEADPRTGVTVDTVANPKGWQGEPLVRLDGVKAKNAKKATPLSGRYRVRLAKTKVHDQVGSTGLLFDVAAEPGADTTATFTLDYTELIKLKGIEWVTRLQLYSMPACALTTPEVRKCQVRTLLTDSSNDPANSAVSATLPAIAEDPSVTPSPSPAPSPNPSPTPGASATPGTPPGSSSTPGGATSDAPSGSPSDSPSQSSSRGEGLGRPAPALGGVRRALATGSATVVAAEPGPGGSQGTYTASSLSASGSWSHGGASGSFAWSYPVSVTPPAAGGAPSVGLSYNSGSVDGLNSNANPQSSWAGLGFDYQPGFIERTFRTCSEMGTGSTDKGLCWAGELLTMHLPGGSTQTLVVDSATGKIRPESDSGERVERLTGAPNGGNDGEYWRVTTTDGTRYTFGLNVLPGGSTATATNSAWNVPVHGGTSTDGCTSSRCTRTWRWNLDMVEDVHNRVTAYYYENEKNYFNPSGATDRAAYDRGGYLSRIDYGIANVGGSIYTVANPPNRVKFTVAERCKATASITCTDAQFVPANAVNWPDVPIDQSCDASGSCATNWPTFWTRKRLATITSSYYTGTAYKDVDSYALNHVWSTNSSTPTLNLNSVIRTAGDGSAAITLPPVSFGYLTMFSRVEGYGGLPDMGYDRLDFITAETGATTRIEYSDEEDTTGVAPWCTATSVPADPSANTMECFPVKWTQPFQTTPTQDYFHKYVVMSVTESDPNALTPSNYTRYTYAGPGWHYDDNEIVKPALRMWAQWRGYRTVDTYTGDTTTTSRNGTLDQTTRSRATYYLGLDGDRKSDGTSKQVTFTDTAGTVRTDSDHFAGSIAETQTFDGATEVGVSRATPTLLATTATRTRTGVADLKAHVVGITKEVKVTRGTGAGTTDLTATTTTTYTEASGSEPFLQRPVQSVQSATGGTGTAQTTCTQSTYADNTTTWVRSAPAETSTYSGATCGGTAPLVARSRSFYDTKTVLGGSNITDGDVTRTETAADTTGGVVRYTTNDVSYDTAGRVLSQTTFPDGVGTPATKRTTGFDYTVTGGVLTAVTTTLPTMPGITGAVTSTQTLDAGRGVPVKDVDIAGRTTSATIDALGRYLSVWAPGQVQGTDQATRTFAYQVQTGQPLAVTTKTLVDPGHSAALGYDTSIQILDSRGIPVQTQTETIAGGRAVTDSYTDSHGWVVATNDRWYTTGAPSTTPVATNDTNIDARTTTTYDRAGRPVTVKGWKGTTLVDTTSTIYGGDRTTMLPPTGAVASTTLVNGLGQTTELRRYTVPVTSTTYAAAANNKTTYSYTAAGQLGAMTTAAGTSKAATWTNTYDHLGRITTAVDPDSGTTTTTYNDTNAITATTDAASKTVSTTYDSWGRPTAKYAGTPATGRKLGSWTYDTLATGQLTATITNAVTKDGIARTFTKTIIGYNAQGKPTGTDFALDVPGFLPKYTTKATYTSTGLTATTQYAATYDPVLAKGNAAETVESWYDKLGQQTGLTGTNAYLTGATYSPYGEPSQYVLGVNNATTALTYTRDPHHRWVTNTLLSGQTATPQVENIAATYDAAGNLTRTIDTQGATGSPTQTTCYKYDSLRQLTEAWAAKDNCAAAPATANIGGVTPFWQTWTYDAAGSREKQTLHTLPGQTAANVVTTYTNSVAGHAHALASSATPGPAATPATHGMSINQPATTNTYTATGATDTTATPSGTTKFNYRDDGTLATITSPGAKTTEYLNDVNGDRVLRIDTTTGTTTTTDALLYLPGQQARFTTTTTGTTTTKTLVVNRFYTLSNGQQVAARKNFSNPVFTLADPHNTTQLTYDPYASSTNPTTKRRAFDPYGNPLTTPTTPTQTWVDDRAYLNKPHNPATGLTDLAARQYNPTTGQFASVDPLLDPTDPLQANGYNYANNNPNTYTDPTGLRPSCVDLSGCADRGTGYMQPDAARPGGWISYAGQKAGDNPNSIFHSISNSVPNFKKLVHGAGNIVKGTAQGLGTLGSNPTHKEIFAAQAQETLSEGYEEFTPEFQKLILLALLAVPVGGPGATTSARVALTAAERALVERVAVGAAKSADELAAIGFRSDTSHIFRSSTGHLAEDTAENRALIQSALDPANLRDTITLKDGATLQKFFKDLPDGTQAWAEVHNGQITNGGLNVIPR